MISGNRNLGPHYRDILMQIQKEISAPNWQKKPNYRRGGLLFGAVVFYFQASHRAGAATPNGQCWSPFIRRLLYLSRSALG